MRILSMTATFGKLDNETIVLKPGLNVLSAPNEWGKSTWCAFLVAMLYGIDTRERSTRDQLADKERYLPWSGKPMEGTLRILHQGRDITIQRRTRGRTPMGEFMAYETKTGLAVRELTADNCGSVLLGVDKHVFQRTGFLRFSDLPVRQDDALRRRLNALVTTGDESGSAELLGNKLRELKNRCRHNQTGLIPECQAQIRTLQEQLWERQDLQQHHDTLEAAVEDQQKKLDDLQLHRAHLAWQESLEDQRRVEDARTSARTAQRLSRALAEKYPNLPGKEEVKAKITQGKSLLSEVELSLVEKPDSSLPIILTAVFAVALLIAALLLMDQGLLVPCIVLGVCLLIAAGALAGKRRRDRIWHSIEQTRLQGKRTELVNFVESWENQLKTIHDLESARENARVAMTRLQDLESMARQAEQPEEPDPLSLGREDTMRSIGEVGQDLHRSRLQLAQYRGRMEGLPDVQTLQRKLASARHRLKELEKYQQAIGYAQSALEEAMQELQRRFAPRIARQAGIYLSRLTGGVYDRIAISDDMTVRAARDDETTLRSPRWRSEGTGDQMYLALRLAVWQVLSQDAPMILDDALIRFDQERMEKAMDLLTELGESRQILLFSCQEREKDYLLN